MLNDKEIDDAVEELMVIYRRYTVDGNTSMEGMAMLLSQLTKTLASIRGPVADKFEEEIRKLEA
jgi:hypothetical protein